MNEKYCKAYVEVLEIISHFSYKEYSKIPKEKIDFFEENKDKKYKFKINTKIDLSKQNISKEAETIMVILFRDYFATEKQKKVLEDLLKQNQAKLEKEKREKYNSNDIFKNNIIKKVDNANELALVEIKEQNLVKRILDFFRSIFKTY